eukprot:TRINITY_DN6768_c0_g1_i1.p1 TRINITY_DN6768_c0_g1~~TRINITY_DN6768_c0_g1_i1.p1  ORF type:complete len:935 (+),score=310.08 TRINITY_DN6768_c0_g1_i1:235-2805(+)
MATIEMKINAMLGCVDGPDPMKQEVALKVIINLAYEPHYRSVIIKSGGVKKLVGLLEDGEEVHQMMSAWGLSNLCADSEELQDMIGGAGGITACLPIIVGGNNADVLEKVLWLLTNLSRTPNNRRAMFSSGYMPALCAMLQNNIQRLQVVELLRNIFQDPVSQEEFCGIRSGSSDTALTHLVNGLDEHNPIAMRIQVALTLAVLCSTSDDVRRKVAEKNVLKKLKLLLCERIQSMMIPVLADGSIANVAPAPSESAELSESDTAKLHCVWCLTNLSLCAEQETAILRAGLVGPLIDLLSSPSAIIVAEVAVLLANLSLNAAIREEVRRLGGVPVVGDLVAAASNVQNDDLLCEALQLSTNLAADENIAYLMKVTGCQKYLEELKARASAKAQPLIEACLKNIASGIKRRSQSAPQRSDASSSSAAGSSSSSSSFASAPASPLASVPRRSSIRFGAGKPDLSAHDGWRRSNMMDDGGRRPSLLGVGRPDFVGSPGTTTRARQESTELVAQLDGKHVRRTNIAQEMLDTERSYVDGLRTLITMYLGPINDAVGTDKQILTKEEIRRMFSFVEVIVKINEEFLGELEKRVSKWNDETEVGDIYLNLCTMLPMYSEYINNYNNAMETMSNCCEENEAFVNFIQSQRLQPECKGLDISSFLILPIQRVPRYQMMLTDLLKRTEESHPDYANLQQAVSRIKDTAEFLNEAKRTSENLAKVVAIQSKLTGFNESLVQAGRKLLMEGECLLSNHGGASKYMYLLLFSDALMFADKRKNKLKYRAMTTLASVRIINKNDTEVLKNAFQVLGTDKTGDSVDFTIYFSNPDDKEKWINCMKDAVHVRKKSDFEMKAARSTKSLTKVG